MNNTQAPDDGQDLTEAERLMSDQRPTEDWSTLTPAEILRRFRAVDDAARLTDAADAIRDADLRLAEFAAATRKARDLEDAIREQIAEGRDEARRRSNRDLIRTLLTLVPCMIVATVAMSMTYDDVINSWLLAVPPSAAMLVLWDLGVRDGDA